MKHKKSIFILVCLIIAFSGVACIAGLVSNNETDQADFLSINNETVKIYGKGLYKLDSVSVASRGKASDFVTLIFAIPVLLISLIQSNKGSFRTRLLLSGTLGYFLYTYMSYTF